jgi:hypothetical protein
MTLLYTQGFEGFPSTTEDRSDFDIEFNFHDTVDTSEAGITTGRSGGNTLAGWFTNGSATNTGSPLLPASGYSQEDTWIVGFGYYQNNGFLYGADGDASVLHFTNPAGIIMLTVILQSGTLRVNTGDEGDATVIAYADFNFLARVWYFIEVKVKFSATVGTVQVRVNEEEVITETDGNKNTSNGATTYLYPSVIRIGQTGDAAACYVDDIYIADDVANGVDDFLGDVALEVLDPNANGTTSDFVGSDADSANNYLLVDDPDVDGDSTYVESNTATEKDTYNVGPLSGTPAAIPAVSVKSYCKKSDGGSRTFKHISRSGGSEETSAVLYPSTGTYRHMQSHFTEDINGGSPQAWTAAAVNSAEFGFTVFS